MPGPAAGEQQSRELRIREHRKVGEELVGLTSRLAQAAAVAYADAAGKEQRPRDDRKQKLLEKLQGASLAEELRAVARVAGPWEEAGVY